MPMVELLLLSFQADIGFPFNRQNLLDEVMMEHIKEASLLTAEREKPIVCEASKGGSTIYAIEKFSEISISLLYRF